MAGADVGAEVAGEDVLVVEFGRFAAEGDLAPVEQVDVVGEGERPGDVLLDEQQATPLRRRGGRGTRRSRRRPWGRGPSRPRRGARPSGRRRRPGPGPASAARRRSSSRPSGRAARPSRGKASTGPVEAALRRRGRPGRGRFSRTVSEGKMPRPSGTWQTPRGGQLVRAGRRSRRRRRAAAGPTSAAAARRRPAAAWSCPAPLGPSSATTDAVGHGERHVAQDGGLAVAGGDAVELEHQPTTASTASEPR